MVTPSFTVCNTCTNQYKIRYGMGDHFPQEASFHCENCGELLVMGYDRHRNVFFKNMNGIDEPTEFTVRNLNPDLIIENGSENDPYYFPTINFVMKQIGQDLKGLPELRSAQRSVRDYDKLWVEIKSDFRFLKEKRQSMLEKNYGKNIHKATARILKKVLQVGRFFIVGKWESVYRDVYSDVGRARKMQGFSDFRTYLRTRKKELLIDKGYDLMSDYENVINELRSSLVAQKCGQRITGKSSNADWEKISKIYGDLFEFYGELLCIPTGINNIIARGDYRQFFTPTFDYTKYLVSDKAHRADNFKNNHKLVALSEYFDAYIRNGTHHKNAQIDKDEQEIILSVGKGGTDTKVITFKEYMEACNELFARTLILLNMLYKIVS